MYTRHLQGSVFLDDFSVKGLSERAKQVKKYKNLETEGNGQSEFRNEVAGAVFKKVLLSKQLKILTHQF